MSIFDDFDKKFEKEIAKLNDEISTGKTEYEEIPFGKYEVIVKELELVINKKGNPMVKFHFVIEAGDFKGRHLFFNKVVNTSFGIHQANVIMSDLAGLAVEWKGNYAQYAETIEFLFAEIENLPYEISYTEGKKGYPDLKIESFLGEE